MAWWKRKKFGVPVWAMIAIGVVIIGAAGAGTKKDEKSSVKSTASTSIEADSTATETSGATESTPAADPTVVDTQASTTVAPTTTLAPTTTSTPTTTIAPTTTVSKVISDGVYAVGTEIQPGVYRVGQYWERLDANQEIIDNDLTSNCPTILIVQPTDVFVKISGGAINIMDSAPLDPAAAGCTDGTFLIGVDIQPGQYKITPGATGSAYWARLDQTLEIIDNDLADGQLIVVIKPSDYALTISGTIAPM